MVARIFALVQAVALLAVTYNLPSATACNFCPSPASCQCPVIEPAYTHCWSWRPTSRCGRLYPSRSYCPTYCEGSFHCMPTNGCNTITSAMPTSPMIFPGEIIMAAPFLSDTVVSASPMFEVPRNFSNVVTVPRPEPKQTGVSDPIPANEISLKPSVKTIIESIKPSIMAVFGGNVTFSDYYDPVNALEQIGVALTTDVGITYQVEVTVFTGGSFGLQLFTNSANVTEAQLDALHQRLLQAVRGSGQSAASNRRFRRWTSICGTYSTVAEFIRVENDRVRLRKLGKKKTISVPFAHLAYKDRRFVQETQHRQRIAKTSRQTRQR